MAKVLIVGEILAEIMAKEVGQRFDSTGIFLGPYASGAPAIFIDQVAKLGVSGEIVGCVGKDGFGDMIVKRLQKDGVDSKSIKRSEHLPTGTAFVTYNSDGSRDFIFNISNSAAGQIDENMIEDSLFNGCEYLHIMGSFLSSPQSRAIIFKCVTLAQKHGTKISFDPNVRPELLSNPGTKDALYQILDLTSIFLPSEVDMEYLFNKGSEENIVKELFSKHPSLEKIVIKKAAKGAVYYDRDGSFSAPAYVVEEIDPTGAGDTFCGAFIASILSRKEMRECLDIACAAGAMAVSARGPMEGTATIEQVASFKAKTSRNAD